MAIANNNFLKTVTWSHFYDKVGNILAQHVRVITESDIVKGCHGYLCQVWMVVRSGRTGHPSFPQLNREKLGPCQSSIYQYFLASIKVN